MKQIPHEQIRDHRPPRLRVDEQPFNHVPLLREPRKNLVRVDHYQVRPCQHLEILLDVVDQPIDQVIQNRLVRLRQNRGQLVEERRIRDVRSHRQHDRLARAGRLNRPHRALAPR